MLFDAVLRRQDEKKSARVSESLRVNIQRCRAHANMSTDILHEERESLNLLLADHRTRSEEMEIPSKSHLL